MDDFNPSTLIDEAVKAGFDAGKVSELDDRALGFAKNIVEWTMSVDYLDFKSIYPVQLQVLLKLFGDVCPYCSDWDFYQEQWEADIDLDNTLDRLQFLHHGRCPKCMKTRLDHYHDKHWLLPEEMSLCWGQRCVPLDSWVFSERGLVRFKDVREGESLSHGAAAKKIYSGKLPSLKITTEYNWIMTGSKESHIVPVLNADLDLEFKKMKDCKIGDHLVLNSPDLWAKERFQLGVFKRQNHRDSTNFPTEVTPELARLVGYLISDGTYNRKHNIRFMSSSPDVDEDLRRCCLAVFGEEPQLEMYREGESPFCKCWCINGTASMEWLNFIGLEPKDKYIPDFILQSPKEIVGEFLGSLFEGEGCVPVEKSKKIRLSYTSVSKTLIEQVRLLLLNMGIVVRLSKSNIHEDVWTIATKDSNYIEIFRQYVRLATKKKIEKLTSSVAKGRTTYKTPIGGFRLKNFESFPEKLKTLVTNGYFFVRITDIRDGEDLEMMDVQVPETNVYTADGFVHHNSGKSSLAAGIGGSYALHRFLQLPQPADYFGLGKGSELSMRFIAIDKAQANDSNWMQFKRSVTHCVWFDKYHDMLKDWEKKKGIEILKWTAEKFAYAHKGIQGYLKGAHDDTSARGRTAIFTSIDEIGQFLGGEKAKKANPDETYDAYEAASMSVRGAAETRFLGGDFNTPTAWMVVHSSPRTKDDYMIKLIKSGQNNPRKVISHLATWQVNPTLPYAKLEEIRKINPEKFDRNFAAIPAFADNPYIASADNVLKHAHLPRPLWQVSTKSSKVGSYLDAGAIAKNVGIPYLLSIDMGRKDCGYGLTLLKLKEEDFSVIQLAGIFAIYPQNGVEVDFDGMFESFIKVLCDRLLIRMVVFDQWQSMSQIDALKKMDIKASKYSLVNQDFQMFRTKLNQGKLELCEPELPLAKADRSTEVNSMLKMNPYLHLIWQMLTVQEIGLKIVKSSKGYDDIFRALVLGCHHLWNEKLRSQFEYKGGVSSKRLNSGSGGLAAGGSFSGNMYHTNPGGIISSNLGSVVTRTKRF